VVRNDVTLIVDQWSNNRFSFGAASDVSVNKTYGLCRCSMPLLPIKAPFGPSNFCLCCPGSFSISRMSFILILPVCFLLQSNKVYSFISHPRRFLLCLSGFLRGTCCISRFFNILINVCHCSFASPRSNTDQCVSLSACRIAVKFASL